MQDHLGDLQDAVVASDILHNYLAWGSWGHGVRGRTPHERGEPQISPGVAAYLAAKQAELDQVCEVARLKELVPLRKKLTEECGYNFGFRKETTTSPSG